MQPDGTSDDLLAAVDAVAPVLERCARQAEIERKLPAEAVGALREVGLFGLKVPACVGGHEADPLTQMDVIERIAHVDTSAAWNLMIGTSSMSFAAAWLPDDGVAEMFGGDTMPIVAGQAVPRGTAEVTDGGYHVTGRFGFGSGIHQADWVLGACQVIEDGEPRMNEHGLADSRVVFVPRADVTVHDTWHVAGLQGTGSSDYTIEQFVPEALTCDLYFGQPRRGGPLYQLPIPAYVGNEIPAFCAGAGRRVLDEMVAMADGTTRFLASSSLSGRAVFQSELGRARARLRAVDLLVRDAMTRAWDDVTKRGRLSASVASDADVAESLSVEEAGSVITSLFRFAGGRALTLDHPVQRCMRDVLAAGQHIAVTNEHFERAGQRLLAAAVTPR